MRTDSVVLLHNNQQKSDPEKFNILQQAAEAAGSNNL
jgi:hypothetical protein